MNPQTTQHVRIVLIGGGDLELELTEDQVEKFDTWLNTRADSAPGTFELELVDYIGRGPTAIRVRRDAVAAFVHSAPAVMYELMIGVENVDQLVYELGWDGTEPAIQRIYKNLGDDRATFPIYANGRGTSTYPPEILVRLQRNMRKANVKGVLREAGNA